MGVNGLTAFLLKKCPDVVKEIPSRLKALSGKTVVIDATLVTQRLHFARSTIPNHHVFRWYRLIVDLKEHDVNVICVFDGKERHAAKIRELQRRREGRATSLARGKLEDERLHRLKTIHPVVRVLNELPSEGKKAVRDLLRSHIQKDVEDSEKMVKVLLDAPRAEPVKDAKEQASGDTVPMSIDGGDELLPMDMEVEPAPLPETSPYLVLPSPPETLPLSPLVPPPTLDEISSLTDGSPSSASTIVKDESAISTPQEEMLPSPPLSPLDETSSSLDVSQTDIMELESPKRKRRRSIKRTPKAITSALTGLFEEYHESIASLEALRAPLPASRFQNVMERSEFLSDSYKRRNEFPTDKTYEESRQLLLTMGVPCVQSEAPFEGEGLASAIALSGYADFVVSEDMDVVLYGAPLLRGITDRTKPLREINGSEIWDALELTRDAFVDFGLLCGTDFTKRIPNVGPGRSLKLIKAHGSIEEVLKHETKYRPSFSIEEYLSHVASARKIFNSLPPVPSVESLRPGEMDQTSVEAILRSFGLHPGMLEDDQHEDFTSLAFEGDHFGDHPHKERYGADALPPVIEQL
ncbi:hypothetical protein FRB91_011664 [Serendipita sp. 411]|nr:hypothetical protein FRB91_011664 [Serendipita sp. 411]